MPRRLSGNVGDRGKLDERPNDASVAGIGAGNGSVATGDRNGCDPQPTTTTRFIDIADLVPQHLPPPRGLHRRVARVLWLASPVTQPVEPLTFVDLADIEVAL